MNSILCDEDQNLRFDSPCFLSYLIHPALDLVCYDHCRTPLDCLATIRTKPNLLSLELGGIE
jgi:hypothetical protein